MAAAAPERRRCARLCAGRAGELPPDIALAYASMLQGAAEAELRSALDRLGRRLWRQQHDQRRCRGRLEQRHGERPLALPPAWIITSRRTRLVGFALAGGGTNWGSGARARQRAERCVPGRRLRHHADLVRPISPARSPSPITGSPPTAPRSAISSPRTSTARATRRAARPAIAMPCSPARRRDALCAPCKCRTSTRRATARPI